MTLFLLDFIDLSFSSSQILGEKEYTNLRKLFIYYFFDGKKNSNVWDNVEISVMFIKHGESALIEGPLNWEYKQVGD